MRVCRNIEKLDGFEGGSVVTIGVYDGLHAGHRKILEELHRQGEARGVPSVALTFDPHPDSVVRPGSGPLLLCSLEARLNLLAAAGVDTTVILHFDKELASEGPDEFARLVLADSLHTAVVVVGADFRFGHKRAGDVDRLSELGVEDGFDVVGVELEPDDSGETISSTRIRQMLATGDVTRAAALLGRYYEVSGVVEKGHGRGGSLLGFPTANLAVAGEIALPSDGVYACWYTTGSGSAHAAAVALGAPPMFAGGEARTVEAYLIDFRGDLYGDVGTLRFVRRLRDQRAFGSTGELVEQMDSDVATVRGLLS